MIRKWDKDLTLKIKSEIGEPVWEQLVRSSLLWVRDYRMEQSPPFFRKKKKTRQLYLTSNRQVKTLIQKKKNEKNIDRNMSTSIKTCQNYIYVNKVKKIIVS